MLARHRSPARLSALPTAGGAIARAAYVLALREKVDVAPLLKRAGLTQQQAEDDKLRIPVRDQIRFLNLVSEALNDEFLGIHLARNFELRELGLLYYVQASSETLGAALQRLARYSGIHNEGVDIRYTNRRDISLKFEYTGVARVADRHQAEFFMTTLVRACRHLTGRHLVPQVIRFVHARGRMPSLAQSYFGCPLEFGAPADEIHYATADAEIPIANADPFLNAMLVKYCEEALDQHRGTAGAWRIKVENALAARLPHGETGMPQIARQLGVSQRTLARRLAAEGVSFFEVMDHLRCELAQRYLRELDLPVSQVSWLLGYEDPSAFNHAFRRWTGKTPSQVRKEAMLEARKG
jgi:AraC-like DNA-binding protein